MVPSVTSTVMLYIDLCSASKGFATTIVPTPLSASKELSKFPPSCRYNRKYNYTHRMFWIRDNKIPKATGTDQEVLIYKEALHKTCPYHLCSALIFLFQASFLHFKTDIATRDRRGRRKITTNNADKRFSNASMRSVDVHPCYDYESPIFVAYAFGIKI